ncbi:hypothetical protein Tco_1085015 [Tanacetum coccineum]
MASNKSFVSSPMVDDCDSFISDVSVNSKPSVTELYAVNDEAFMVDKKYVNVTDLNLVSDEKVSISDRDDLEKKIDDVQVLDNVVCVDRNKDVYGSEAKTSAVVASVVIKEVGSDNVDVNTDEVVADEDVDLAGNNVFVADKKSCSDAKRDESGDADMNNCTDIPKFAADADNNVSISDRDDLEKKIHDVQVLDNVVCVDRTKDVYGIEAKTSAADYVVIKECYDGKQDESGDIDLNNCPDIPNFAADADSNEL